MAKRSKKKVKARKKRKNKSPKKKVKNVIAEFGEENSVTIKDFVRYKVGE